MPTNPSQTGVRGFAGSMRRHRVPTICVEVGEAALGAVVKAVEEAGGHVLSVQGVRQSLEDYFMKEMGTQATEGAWELEG